LIQQRRQQPDPLLVLDAGDALIHDRTPAISTQGATSIELMNMLGYDAMVLGEGDLEILGVSAVQQRMQEANFAVLSANVVLKESGELLAQPYAIWTFGGHRVAVIGVTGAADLPDVEILDPLEATKAAVDQLRDQADILILLSHAGLSVNRQIAEQVPEIDLIVSGGGQESTDSPERVDMGPAIVHADVSSPAHAGRRVGVGTWTFDAQGRLTQYDWNSIALTTEIVAEPTMDAWASQHP
jgi:2',3'-cyclic-nucleotide 2'-phosphodiesterase (5'-nucleotidase family)